jgi:hypothetical protein
MTEQEFEDQFDRGNLDCDFAMFISEQYDAWSKDKMLYYWEDLDVYEKFKDSMVTSTMLQDAYFDGKHPLDGFPSIFGDNK